MSAVVSGGDLVDALVGAVCVGVVSFVLSFVVGRFMPSWAEWRVLLSGRRSGRTK